MLLNYLLPFTKQKLIKENLLIFQNIYALIICCQSLYSIYDWITTSSTVLLFNASVYLKIYLITDLLLCSQELIVHHICSIILIQSSINIFCVNPILQHYIVIIYSTELSTLFLIFHILFEQFHIKNKLTDVNDLLFIITFAYTRIYLFTKYIIFDKQLYDLLYETVPYYNIICVCIYTLYILNLYWFFIIIKKLVKPLPKLSTYYCEKALKYTYFLSLVGSFYLYRSYHNILFTVDIIGQILLCISSYNYHYVLELELAKGNTEDKIDTLSNHIILKYLYEPRITPINIVELTHDLKSINNLFEIQDKDNNTDKNNLIKNITSNSSNSSNSSTNKTKARNTSKILTPIIRPDFNNTRKKRNVGFL